MSQVFYVPGQPLAIDYAHQNKAGHWVAQRSGLLFCELRMSYPGVVVGDESFFLAAQARRFGTVPEHIERSSFEFALHYRKVIDHPGAGDSESFKLADMTVGNITSIYARIGTGYWLFQDVATLPHCQIIQRITGVN